MIEFNVDDDFIYTKLENLIPLDDPILLNHYYRLREIFVDKYLDYGKEFIINQNFYLLKKINDKNISEDTFLYELKNSFTKNEILYLTASLFACEGIRIR